MSDKQQFKNNTSAYIGATVIGVKGDERGVPVPPHGTVWLSEAEQILTANAPREAKDNPFIEQTFTATNPETNEREEYRVIPLTPVSGDRYVPSDIRYVPGNTEGAASVAQASQAATGPEPVTMTTMDLGAMGREAEVMAEGRDAQPGFVAPTPAAAAAVAAANRANDGLEEEVAASLAASEPQAPEETGAATTPSAEAPQGEYVAGEEVGTPVAPEENAAEPDETGADQTPAQPTPYTPPGV